MNKRVEYYVVKSKNAFSNRKKFLPFYNMQKNIFEFLQTTHSFLCLNEAYILLNFFSFSENLKTSCHYYSLNDFSF